MMINNLFIEVQTIVPTIQELMNELQQNNIQMTEKLRTDLMNFGTDISKMRKGILLNYDIIKWFWLIRCITSKL